MRARARAIHRPGVMNKTEAAYGFYLSDLQNKGEIREFKFEAVKLILGNRCSYTPDFMVVRPDGTLEFHVAPSRVRGLKPQLHALCGNPP